MPNLADYIAWRGDLPFTSAPLCEVDNLLFSLIAYIDWDGVVPPPDKGRITLREAAKEYFFTHDPEKPHPLGLIVPAEIITLFRAMADTPRYRSVELCGYVNEISAEQEKQFSAITLRLFEDACFVAFRGTDDTIVGWREDFNLSFLDEVPSQCRAVEYLDALDLPPEADLYVGGHSKGGNLAVWGAVHATKAIKSRIRRVFSNDGPGFSEGMTDSAAYREIADRLTFLLPEDSLVGLLLEHDEGYEVIKSARRGLYQHDGMSWEVMGDRFVRTDGLSRRGIRTDTVIRNRIAAMSREEKETLVRLIFDVLDSTGAKTLTDLRRGSFRTVAALVRSVADLSREEQETGLYLLRKLLSAKELPEKTETAEAAEIPPPPAHLPPKKAPVRVEFGWCWRKRASARHAACPRA